MNLTFICFDINTDGAEEGKQNKETERMCKRERERETQRYLSRPGAESERAKDLINHTSVA